jgi:hypothetical protein
VNYLAHALAFLDVGAADTVDDGHHAFRVAGTALPDWLRVVDKRARLRPDVLDEVVVDDDARFAALRDGARRHHDDDLRFHADDAFDVIASDVAARLRALDPGLRASTLGHVLVEMLVDAALMQARPGLIERYYDVLDDVDEARVAAFARRATRRPLVHAEHLIDRFRRTRFLLAYRDDEGLLDCLVGVCRRAGLQPPPSSSRAVIAAARHEVVPLAERFFADTLAGR